MQTYCQAVREEGVQSKTIQVLRQTHCKNPQFLIFADIVDQYIETRKGEDEQR